MSVTSDQITAALKRVIDPELHKDIVTLEMVKNVTVEAGRAKVHIELTTPACPMKERIKSDIEMEIAKLDDLTGVDIEWSAHVRPTPNLAARLPGVKNTVEIGAGKGGVGKSTIAVLAAVGLAREGARIGLMDADFYGQSIPKMLGVEFERPNGKRLHISAVYRWTLRGVKGIRLETVKIGGTTYTSREAIQRFSERLSGADPAPQFVNPVSRARQRQLEQANAAVAKALGIEGS